MFHKLVKIVSSMLDSPVLYNLWQAPFYRKKMRLFLKDNELNSGGRHIVELGCGPATNVNLLKIFNSYLGIDNELAYVKYAQSKYPELNFICADVCTFDYKELKSLAGKTIHLLVNSLLHHLSDDQVRQLFMNLKQINSESLHIHVIDMVVPEKNSIPKYLALNDRGRFARTEIDFRKLLEENLNIAKDYKFDLKFIGVKCWKMVYFQTTFKTES